MLQLIKKDKLLLLCLLVFAAIQGLSLMAWLMSGLAPGVMSELPFFRPPNKVYEEFLKLPPFWMQGGMAQFPLGTDDLGRDFLSRLLSGGKISFMAGFSVMAVSLIFGLIFGVWAGWSQRAEPWIMGAVDVLMSFPGLLTAIVIVAVLGPGLVNACAAASLACLPVMIRLVRSLVLRERGKEYVESGKSFGAPPLRLIFYHILPNASGEIFAQALLNFSEGILSVAALSFLGLGAEPPLAEWGVMVSDGRSYIDSAWWLVAFPGLCILALSLCVNIIGERLKFAFDPKALSSRPEAAAKKP